MAFVGLKTDEEIKAVLAYLATFDPDGMAPNRLIILEHYLRRAPRLLPIATTLMAEKS